jgi:GNAT superfamily N-acetyltransferase
MPFNRYSFHAKFRAGWKDAGSIDLTGGFVVVDPSSMHGQRIGTYLFNEVIDWAKQWPDAVITPIKLVETDHVNKIRRNHFYARFGFSFDFKDDIDRISCVNKSVWTENEWHYQNPIQFMFKTLYKRYFFIWCSYSVFGLLVFLVGRDIIKKLST